MNKRIKKFVLEIESKGGWWVCFIVGKKLPVSSLKSLMRKYNGKSSSYFTICTEKG